MLEPMRQRLTYANVVATLALLVALSGSAYAVNQIGSPDVKDRSLRGVDVKRNSISGKEIKEGSLAPVKRAKVAANAKALGGQPASTFEKSSRTSFRRASANPPSVADEGLLLAWPAIGLRITGAAQGGCSESRVTLRITNTRTSGATAVRVYGAAAPVVSVYPNTPATACSFGAGIWHGVVTVDNDPRTLVFTCERIGDEMHCVGTRSQN